VIGLASAVLTAFQSVFFLASVRTTRAISEFDLQQRIPLLRGGYIREPRDDRRRMPPQTIARLARLRSLVTTAVWYFAGTVLSAESVSTNDPSAMLCSAHVVASAYLAAAGFIKPCQPNSCPAPPFGDGWLQEIKPDG
jgi:hypothetical protein